MDAIGLVGLTFRSQGADAVARFTVAREAREEAVAKLAAELGVAELVYLATCNRVEILYRERDGRRATDRRRDVFRVLTGQEPQPGEAEHLLRGWHGEGAVEHLFVVAAGLDSAQVGEREIQGQLRDALDIARAANTAAFGSGGKGGNGAGTGTGANGLLGRLVEEALRVAHQVHRNSALGEGRLSLAEIAADHLLERVRRVPGRVALIGVSPMTRKCGEALAREHVPLVVVNRTLERAEELASALGNAFAMSLDDFRARPPRIEALVAATGSPEAVLDRACLERLAARSPSGEPPLAVDLAVPPDVDPAAARSAGIPRLGMDEINREADEQRSRRQAETAAARELVDAALDELRHRLAERVLSPVLARINQRYRQTAAEGMERLLAKEGAGFDARQREALGRWAEMLAKRLAHLPTLGLRGLASELGVEAVGSFLAAGDAELYAEFNDIAGALDPLAGNPEMQEMPEMPRMEIRR
jgi:glutamyl-tRNA reductase